jgi:hypothetical protein
VESTILSEEVVVLGHKVSDCDVDDQVYHFAQNLEVAKLVPEEREDALDNTNYKD